MTADAVGQYVHDPDADRPVGESPIVVMYPRIRPTTNPYVTMLRRAIDAEPGCITVDFSWRRAILGRYDVVHLHWPEILLAGRTPARSLAKEGLFATLLVRLRVTRRAVVRTLHNLDLPSGLTPRQLGLLRKFEQQTALWITINESTPVPPGAAHELVLHGHYRDWYARFPKEQPATGAIAYVGLIRSYKGVEGLVRAFAATRSSSPGLRLAVSGMPSSETLAATLTDLAGDDPRISFRFAFLSDAELVARITSAELVCLPYREMHNSGTVLAALSLGRPVLVPDNEVNGALSAEVGQGWVMTYSGELGPDALIEGLGAAQARLARGGEPDLGARDWSEAGKRHVLAYRRARDLVRRGTAARA